MQTVERGELVSEREAAALERLLDGRTADVEALRAVLKTQSGRRTLQ